MPHFERCVMRDEFKGGIVLDSRVHLVLLPNTPALALQLNGLSSNLRWSWRMTIYLDQNARLRNKARKVRYGMIRLI